MVVIHILQHGMDAFGITFLPLFIHFWRNVHPFCLYPLARVYNIWYLLTGDIADDALAGEGYQQFAHLLQSKTCTENSCSILCLTRYTALPRKTAAVMR